MRYFQLILQSIWTQECDYDTDSDNEDGLECDNFDYKWLQDIKVPFMLKNIRS